MLHTYKIFTNNPMASSRKFHTSPSINASGILEESHFPVSLNNVSIFMSVCPKDRWRVQSGGSEAFYSCAHEQRLTWDLALELFFAPNFE